MEKNILFRGLCVLGVVLAGCATATVSSDYNRSTDFSMLKTYAWAGEQAPMDIRFDTPDLRETIQRSVETELQSKGLQKVTAGNPDIHLKYYITVEQKKDFVADYQPPAFNSRLGAAGIPNYAVKDAMTVHYEEGTFVLDILNPVSGEILWRGSLESIVDPGAPPAKRIERVPGAVAKIFKKFPPGHS